MPLNQLGDVWPPPPWGPALVQQSVWSAWYTGDPEGLIAAYSLVNGHPTDFFNTADSKTGRQTPYGSGPGGGVFGAIARFFWGRPSVSGLRKARLHVPLASDIATASADLLFSDPPSFYIDDGKPVKPKTSPGAAPKQTPAEKRVDDILNSGNFFSELIECAEIASALGGGWLRLVWDKDIADYVMIETISADSAFGEWRWGVLQAVTFFTEYLPGSEGDQEVIRHLERHEPGAIFHGLYKGTKNRLGRPIPLETLNETIPYADVVDENGAVPTGVKGITAGYVSNMRPQRRWRKMDQLQNLGRSDLDGIESMMDALDETYTSWMRDIRLAKARIMVPEYMMRKMEKGQGVVWDEDQEVYTKLNIMASENGTDQITMNQFAIRFNEHQQTAQVLTENILRAAGYSATTFGLKPGTDRSAATATEIVSRERSSIRTRDKKIRYWTQTLEPLLSTWLELDAKVFNTGAKLDPIGSRWPDQSQPDPLTQAQTVELLNRAEAVSLETKVKMQHSDWDDQSVKDEVARIQSETGRLVPDPGPVAPPPTPKSSGKTPVMPTGMGSQD